MTAAKSPPAPIEVYTTVDGHAVIEQGDRSIILHTAEQIGQVIETLHVCYDYCAAWKPPAAPGDS